MGLRVWSGGAIFSKKINKKRGITKVKQIFVRVEKLYPFGDKYFLRQ